MSAGIAGIAAGAGGMVIVNSCDGMRRLYDAWAHSVKSIPVVFLDVPQRRDTDAVDYFAVQLEQFSRQIERDFGGSRPSRDILEQQIVMKNSVRRKMMEVFRLQREESPRVSGSAVFSLLMDVAAGDPEVAADRIDSLIAGPGREITAGLRKRIVVSANVIDRPDLIDMIEGSNALVVALDTCIGRRSYELQVAEGTSDPIRAVAQRYLTRPPCSRMDGMGDRIDYVVDLARASRADGVVLTTVKYCDSWLYEQPLLKERLEAAGLRVLALENDYEWSGTGQMRTRIEAFLETVAEGGK
jgi:benzoyl-CoA reductase/2-hydroxyglutaryl-CoA dehydratase subunit BcrC/BadD/HgdB